MNDINSISPHDRALCLRILPAVVYLCIVDNILIHMDETTQLTSLKHCCCAILFFNFDLIKSFLRIPYHGQGRFG